MKPEGGFGGASFAAPSPAVVTRTIIALCVLIQIAASVRRRDLRGDTLASHAALIPARLTDAIPSQPGEVPAVLDPGDGAILSMPAGFTSCSTCRSCCGSGGTSRSSLVGSRFIALYLLSGIAGGLLLQVAVGPASTVQVVGASGAIAGVFGAYAVLFAQSRAGPRRVFGLTIGAEVVTGLWYLATWIGLQLLTAVAFNTGEGGIAIWTHIGGFVVGLIAAQAIARRLRQDGVVPVPALGDCARSIRYGRA